MDKIKKLVIYGYFLLCTCIGLYSQSPIKIDPTSLGLMLIDQPSVKNMAGICEYYNLREEPEEDGFRVFRHPNGMEFRFKATKEKGGYFPVVIMEIKENDKTVERILSEAGYVKEGNNYVKGSKFELRRTRCRVTGGEHKTLSFEKEYNLL